MSLAVVNNSSTSVRSYGQVQSPTTNLAAALSEFEAILSDRQRLTFRSNFRKPVATDVLVFVSRIDADNKTRGRKCVAPRLCTFLERTAQFAGIVDSFVQSNPTIAALVWGGVKTALLTASNIASYFDKVTSMIMKLSRVTPVYQRFGQLYPGCVDLQAALCDYYATIVRMCGKIIEVAQRSTIAQFFSPVFNPFEIEFKDVLESLTLAAKNVDIEISFASQKAANDEARLAEAERKENSLHWRVMSQFQSDWKSDADKWRVEKHSRHANKIRCEIMENLCPVDHMKAWRQAKEQCLPGTAEWFPAEAQFQRWYSTAESSVLWCCGKLGAGKTVLVSSVIAWLLNNLQSPAHLVSYFFCRSDDSRTLTARNVIGSICRQLLHTTIGQLTYDELTELLKDTKDLSTSEVLDLMADRLEDTVCYIVLDGLDECDNSAILAIAQALESLSHNTRKQFRILCSGRPELEYSLFKVLHPVYKLLLSGNSVDLDIERYISETLDRYLEEDRLIIGDPELILEIVRALRSGANGMFLWARLLIEELCYYSSDDEVRDALADLPRGLFEIYERKMAWIDKQVGSSNATRSLALCCVLRRALTTDEMREALTLELGQKSLQTVKMVNNIGKVISACRGLLQMDEQEDTIHFVHHSVKQFLTASSGFNLPIVQEEAMNLDLGRLCLTYLDFRDFERQVVRWKPTSFYIEPLAVSQSIASSDRQKTAKLAQKLLKLKGVDMSKQIEMQVNTWQSVPGAPFSHASTDAIRQYHFLPYARDHWIYHLQDLCPSQGQVLWNLFCALIRKQEQAQHVTDHFFPITSDCDGMREFALRHDHAALMKYSISEAKVSVEGVHIMKLLARASTQEKRRLRLVLVENLMPTLGSRCSLETNHNNFVQLILEADTGYRICDSWLRDNKYLLLQNMLTEAITYHRPDIVMQLFKSGELQIPGPDAWSIFVYSIEDGIADLVRPLVEQHKYSVNLTIDNAMTPLQVAAIRQHTEVAIQLLKAGASASPTIKYSSFSPLAAAAWNGDAYLVEELVQYGAQINPSLLASGLFTPLEAAARNKQVAMVEYLLKNKADPNLCNGRNLGTTALELACEGGSSSIVKKLLIAGAEVNETTVPRRPRSSTRQQPPAETVAMEGKSFSSVAYQWPAKVFQAIDHNDPTMEDYINKCAMQYVGPAEEYQWSEERRTNLQIVDWAASLHNEEVLDLILRNVSTWMPPNEARERAIRNATKSWLVTTSE